VRLGRAARRRRERAEREAAVRRVRAERVVAARWSARVREDEAAAAQNARRA
jgi:hypothetical protein